MTIRYVGVGPSASDTNPGTSALPFATIAKGLSVSVASDTLYLKQGSYTQTIISIPSGTSWATAFTLASAPGEVATLFNSSASCIDIADNSNSRYIIIDRLVFSGLGGGSPTSAIHGLYIGTTTNHISITACEIKNQPGIGAYLRGDHNEIRDCSVTNNYNHGIQIAGSSTIADNNSVQNNGGAGIYVFDQGSVSVSANIVRNNRCFSNGAIYKANNGFANYFLTTGVWLSSGTGNIAYNNIIANHQGAAGLYIVTNSTNSKAYNNTIYACEARGIVTGATSTGTVLQNNICWLNTVDAILDTGTSSSLITNLIGIDPKFVDAAALNFSLQGISPAIDAGTATTNVTVSITGIPRPQGNNYDIGAYEYFLVAAGNALWWAFEEATGSTVADKSGLGFTGTFVNNPTRLTGVSGPYAINFNGSSNYIENTAFTWSVNSPVTVCFWVNTPGGTAGGGFDVGHNTTHRLSCHCPYADNILYWDYGDWQGTGRITASLVPYLNSWTHITLVSAGALGAFKAIYLNGILVSSAAVSGGPGVPLTGLTLGKSFLSGVNFWHLGAIDDFQIFNAVLSQQDIYNMLHMTPPARSIMPDPIRPLLSF